MSKAGRVFALACGRRSKWVVLGLWVVALVVSMPLAGKLTGAESNEASSWLPGSAESTAVLNLQKDFQSDDSVPALVVYERDSGITTADQARAARDAQQFADVDMVSGKVTGPIPAKDGKALQVIVPVVLADDSGWQELPDVVDQLRDVTDGSGMNVHITGPAGYAAAQATAFEGIDGTLLYAALGVVIIMLLLTYRSPVLWFFPVISAGGALLAAEAVIYLLATRAGLTVNAQSAGILTVLVFGAGTDYALLLVARYREELRRHADRHEAMAAALRRAGPAILASAATVAVGMLCLLTADLNSTRGLGPVAAIGVGVGLLAMLTLLPAVLVVMGRWVFWPVRPTHGSPEPTQRGLWARVGRGISRRPRVVWVTTVLVLGGLALGVTGLRATGLSNADALTGKPDAVVGEQVLARHFPAGQGQPIVVIAKAPQAEAVRIALANTDGVVDTDIPVPPKDGLAYLTGTMRDAPDSRAGQDTVDRVRDAVHQVPDADARVGGNTAILLDTNRAASHDSHVIIPLVLVVVLVILGLLLRAIVAPLILIATVVLSFGAALGVSTLVFHHVFGFAGEDTSFPLFVFVFLVALGIDYNIFLMTRVREEAERVGTRRGALIGLGATGGVITSAGLVLAGTFAVLATLPAVAFAEIGFAVAFGVLLDTLIVRSVLVTALNLEVGRWMWWPHRLSGEHVDHDVTDRAAEPALTGS